MANKKITYVLIERGFNQPSFGAFMSGVKGDRNRKVGTTTSLFKAKEWEKKSCMNIYRIEK
jgi:hypothetical protein